MHLLAGGFHCGAGTILVFLGLSQFLGLDQDLRTGRVQGLGLVGDLLFSRLDFRIQDGKVRGKCRQLSVDRRQIVQGGLQVAQGDQWFHK